MMRTFRRVLTLRVLALEMVVLSSFFTVLDYTYIIAGVWGAGSIRAWLASRLAWHGEWAG